MPRKKLVREGDLQGNFELSSPIALFFGSNLMSLPWREILAAPIQPLVNIVNDIDAATKPVKGEKNLTRTVATYAARPIVGVGRIIWSFWLGLSATFTRGLFIGCFAPIWVPWYLIAKAISSPRGAMAGLKEGINNALKLLAGIVIAPLNMLAGIVRGVADIVLWPYYLVRGIYARVTATKEARQQDPEFDAIEEQQSFQTFFGKTQALMNKSLLDTAILNAANQGGTLLSTTTPEELEYEAERESVEMHNFLAKLERDIGKGLRLSIELQKELIAAEPKDFYHVFHTEENIVAYWAQQFGGASPLPLVTEAERAYIKILAAVKMGMSFSDVQNNPDFGLLSSMQKQTIQQNWSSYQSTPWDVIDYNNSSHQNAFNRAISLKIDQIRAGMMPRSSVAQSVYIQYRQYQVPDSVLDEEIYRRAMKQNFGTFFSKVDQHLKQKAHVKASSVQLSPIQPSSRRK